MDNIVKQSLIKDCKLEITYKLSKTFLKYSEGVADIVALNSILSRNTKYYRGALIKTLKMIRYTSELLKEEQIPLIRHIISNPYYLGRNLLEAFCEVEEIILKKRRV